MSGGIPRFSVVVPSRGEARNLVALLDALERQTLPRERFEIIVALDGAAAAEATVARLSAAGARVVRLEQRRGPGAARNRAAAEACGEFLAFTEDDVVPAADWLDRAATRLAAEPAIDVLEGRTVKPSQRSAEVPASELPLYLPTNLFVRRTLFERVGGYHEGFFDPEKAIYFREDSDFGFTLEEAGARIVRDAAAVVTHPVEHTRWLDPIRWARRFEMDALLAARHPRRFRERIELQRLGPLTVRRPVVRASWLCVLAIAAALIVPLLGRPDLTAWFLALAAGTVLPIWAKWRFSLLRLPVVLLVPFVLIGSLMRGWVRVRTGVMR